MSTEAQARFSWHLSQRDLFNNYEKRRFCGAFVLWVEKVIILCYNTYIREFFRCGYRSIYPPKN